MGRRASPVAARSRPRAASAPAGPAPIAAPLAPAAWSLARWAAATSGAARQRRAAASARRRAVPAAAGSWRPGGGVGAVGTGGSVAVGGSVGGGGVVSACGGALGGGSCSDGIGWPWAPVGAPGCITSSNDAGDSAASPVGRSTASSTISRTAAICSSAETARRSPIRRPGRGRRGPSGRRSPAGHGAAPAGTAIAGGSNVVMRSGGANGMADGAGCYRLPPGRRMRNASSPRRFRFPMRPPGDPPGRSGVARRGRRGRPGGLSSPSAAA